MGSVEEAVVEELEFDVEDTIFVAVGTNVEKSKTVLFWAVHNFSGKNICLLHVHQPAPGFALTMEDQSSNKKEHVAVEAFCEVEMQKLHELLNQYLVVLAQAGVQANKVWVKIKMKTVEKGIVNIIAQHNVRWLVMGSTARKYKPGRPAWLQSKKASFVCHQAPKFCHIWVVCQGNLLYTRGGHVDRSAAQISSLLLSNSEIGTEFAICRSESVTQLAVYEKDSEEDEIGLDGMLRRLSSNCILLSSCSNHRKIDSLTPIPLVKDEEEKSEVQIAQHIQSVPEQAVMDVKNSKGTELEVVVKPLEEEDAAMVAKALESLYVEEISKRRDMTEMLAREKQEVERMTSNCDELKKELRLVQEQKSLLESQLAECQCSVKELEDKIITAVELLISFKERRDKVQIEHEYAIRELKQVRNLVEKEVPTFCRAEMPIFSFMEVIEATNNFDPSWKIAEGRYGSVYKGFYRHMDIAIKMFPSYGSQTQLEFQYEVEVLSRVRHPNLITLVGSSPESRSLIYEYLRNGSLEDRLACKNGKPPLPWQLRISIATELCSVLIFLHHNKPCIVHGNLKPSKVLLDANFVTKLGGLGIFHFIPHDNINLQEETTMYVDLGFFETKEFTPESDVYSFGLILLRLLTGRPLLGIVKDVKCALQMENISAVLDISAGEWPLELAEQIAILALRCCEKNKLDRPDLESEIWNVLEPMRDIAATSFFDSNKCCRAPSHFVCPILQEIMNDPLIAADGFTYEAEAIRGWFNTGHDTSPMTNLKLEHCNLVPNYALQNAIQEWQQQL